MSVPKFRNSKSKVRRRRSHHALKPVHVVIDKETGEARLPHHAAPSKSEKVKAKDALAKQVVEEMKKNEEEKKEEKSASDSKKEDKSAKNES